MTSWARRCWRSVHRRDDLTVDLDVLERVDLSCGLPPLLRADVDLLRRREVHYAADIYGCRDLRDGLYTDVLYGVAVHVQGRVDYLVCHYLTTAHPLVG